MFRKFAGLSTRTKLTAILVALLIPVGLLLYFETVSSLATIRYARNETRAMTGRDRWSTWPATSPSTATTWHGWPQAMKKNAAR